MPIKIYKKFYDPTEANIVASKLQENGVECFLNNEHATRMLWHISVAHGGVALMMEAEDFEEADAILAEDHSLLIKELENAEEPGHEQEQDIHCPACGSNNVSYGTGVPKVNWWLLIVSFLTFAPAPIPMKSFHCHNCGKDFRINRA